mgnify:CR=1 FL=1
MALLGIDVSTHNKYIDWSTVKKRIDFAIIRAGYGSNHIDACAIQNAKGCIENKIPFGLYWFSYALSVEDAIKEADYVCDFADIYTPVYPIAYDWEYDSDNYAKLSGKNITNTLRRQMATAFLNRVRERGYKPMLYTNADYIEYKGFNNIPVDHYTWLASWTATRPTKYKHDFWQYSAKGNVEGINTDVDMNYCYLDATDVFATTEETKEKIDTASFIKEFKELYSKYFG